MDIDTLYGLTLVVSGLVSFPALVAGYAIKNRLAEKRNGSPIPRRVMRRAPALIE